MKLNYNITFTDLYQRDGLIKIDNLFLDYLKEDDLELYNKLLDARLNYISISNKDKSELIIEIAYILDNFLAEVFNIKFELIDLKVKHAELKYIHECKRLFVQRKAIKKYKEEEIQSFNLSKIITELAQYIIPLSEENFAKKTIQWLSKESEYQLELELASKFTAYIVNNKIDPYADWVIFKNVKKIDFANLIEFETEIINGIKIRKIKDSHLKYRNGFKLTDNGADLKFIQDNTGYCIYCHNQGKDSCSKGLWEKDHSFKINPLGIKLTGCPLEEKISEMNFLKSNGVIIGSLAVVVIDNPMLPATGHRICNDCMKSCIYQKQQPVDIPQIESRVLKDVLHLPYGFEIYSLLTRWNPLNFIRPIIKENTGRNILVVGLGPAGFTLSHHLLCEGHNIVAIDGLKIEPLDPLLSGKTINQEINEFIPIKHIEDIKEELDERIAYGFGGVAEYGITARWDKNFLKIIRILLERNQNFMMFGGIRFGSQINYKSSFELGFDHIALCNGDGRPNLLDLKNPLALGVKMASDFLMSLQSSGAARKESLANLQIRMPIVVIGGGLTAIDTATEAFAYYPIQVEKILDISEKIGYFEFTTPEEEVIFYEFISHAKEIREEKALALKEGRSPDIIKLMRKWGGVTVIYRKSINDAPSYRLNHEEVELAMQEGIYFAENLTPEEVILDKYGYAQNLVANDITKQKHTILAKTILVAAGTMPNTVLGHEDRAHFKVNGKYFQAIDENGNNVTPEQIAKPEKAYFLSSLNKENKSVTFFGDLHPSYAGNVVKAMASAKIGYPYINKLLENLPKSSFIFDKIRDLFITKVYEVNRLTSNIVEVIIESKLAAKEFKPGQFFRLQNYEYFAKSIEINGLNFKLAMEGLAMTGAWVDKTKGLVSIIALEMGGSSNLCSLLNKGEPVVLMGPTGTPTEIDDSKNVLLIGGGLGNAVLFSIGKAFIEKGANVIYFAGYKKLADRYKIKEIEEAGSEVVWCCEEGLFEVTRIQDQAFHGNIVEAISNYANQGKLKEIDKIIAIGSDRMMEAIKIARQTVLKGKLNHKHKAIASINSPMQCMMKEICAQCLQKHIDPTTGIETYVYSCFNQDQDMDLVDFDHLKARLKQNNVQEKVIAKVIKKITNY